MQLRFEEITAADIDCLAQWFPGESWPYHARPKVDAVWVNERAAAGYFYGRAVKSFRVVADDSGLLGIVRAFDLDDVTPLIDLRIAGAFRGRGVGTDALRWITEFVFETYPDTHRLGGYTHCENIGMRLVFQKCGFVQEACHRQAWRTQDAAAADAVGYAILRSDWSTGSTTPVRWA